MVFSNISTSNNSLPNFDNTVYLIKSLNVDDSSINSDTGFNYLFSISYIYLALVGLITTVFVGLFVSLLTFKITQYNKVDSQLLFFSKWPCHTQKQVLCCNVHGGFRNNYDEHDKKDEVMPFDELSPNDATIKSSKVSFNSIL